MLCYDFRRGLLSEFFAVPRQQPEKDKVRDVVVGLRKRNYSIYDITIGDRLEVGVFVVGIRAPIIDGQ